MLDWIRRAGGPRPLSHVFIGLVLAAGLETALLAACSGARNEPRKVAGEFWAALQDQDLSRAKTFASRASAGLLQVPPAGASRGMQFEIGEQLKRGGTATVATVVTGGLAGSDFPIAVQTLLVKEDGGWKVDAHRTLGPLYGTTVTAASETR